MPTRAARHDSSYDTQTATHGMWRTGERTLTLSISAPPGRVLRPRALRPVYGDRSSHEETRLPARCRVASGASTDRRRNAVGVRTAARLSCQVR
jgi:hypothetical protein